MTVLADTSLLLRTADQLSGHYESAILVIEALASGGHEIVIGPQCIYEFWVVATRPTAVNGLGLSPSNASKLIRELISRFPLRSDTPGLALRWLGLVEKLSVVGRQGHDARLVAFMLEHEIETIVTFNGADFARYPEVKVIDPRDPTTYATI